MTKINFESMLYNKLFDILEKDLSGAFSNEDSVLDEIDDNNEIVQINSNLKIELDNLLKIENDAIKNGVQKDLLDYSQITKYFYNQSSKKDYFPGISKLRTYIAGENNKKILLKLLNHSELAIVQKVSLSDRINNLENELKKQIEIAEDLTEQLKQNSDSNDKELEKIKKSLPELVGVMGIFATVIFAVFSGFNEITTLGASLNTTPLDKLLIFIGSTLLMLIGIIFISYLSIGYFFRVSLRSCGCELKEKCSHTMYEKYPTIMLFCWIATSFMSIGGIIIIFNKYFNLPRFNIVGYNLFICILLFVLICVPVIGTYIILKSNKFISFKKTKMSKKDTP